MVYYEEFTDIYHAIAREKQIKKWKRQWKINLIESKNPQWINLTNGIF
jgi:putative endonuclease